MDKKTELIKKMQKETDEITERDERKMKDIIMAVIATIIIYFIALCFGTWCGVATFLLLILFYHKTDI